MGVRFKQVPNYSRMKEEFRQEVVKEMSSTAMDAVEDIKTNTASGVDYRGKSFVPYSKAYGRRKAGETKVATARPNLWVKGGMIGSISYQVASQGSKIIAKVKVADGLQAMKANWNNRLREFFAISLKSRRDFNERMTSIFGRLKR